MALSEYRRLFERGKADHPLTPHKLRLLLFVAECQILTVPQLAGLSGYTERSTRLHMRDLFDLGLVERHGVPRAALADLNTPNNPELLWGRAPTIYSLSKEGAKLLVQQGLAAKEDVSDLPEYGPRNALFLAHELGVRDVRVWLERLKNAYVGHEGAILWRDGPRATIYLDRKEYPREVRPDACFVYRFRGATLVGLVEVDRGTERSPSRWQEKFVAYQALYQGSRIEELTGQKQGRVLVITPDERRRENIAAILRELIARADIPADRFWLAEKAVLTSTDLTQLVWRVPERDTLMPLVVARFL